MTTITFQIKIIIDIHILKWGFALFSMVLHRKIRLKAEFLSKIDTLRSRPPVPIGVPAIFAVRKGQIGVVERCVSSLISLSYFRKLNFLEIRQKRNFISPAHLVRIPRKIEKKNDKSRQNTQILAVII